jgi:hypothetical protein
MHVPEMQEWAMFFAMGAPRRAAAEAGLNVISQREADDLMRDANLFVSQAMVTLGLDSSLPMQDSA